MAPRPQRAPAIPRRRGAALAQHASRIGTQLAALYPDAHCALHFETPLQLLVATILSAQSTDARVNLVTPALFRKFRRPADFADHYYCVGAVVFIK